MSISITQKTRSPYPKLDYEEMADAIIGDNFCVSLVFIGATRAKKLNIVYRNQMYIPNVLAFSLTNTTGEIFITPAIAKKEAKKISMSNNGYIGYLFIHALLHLKGMEHGDTMKKAEARYISKFKLK